MKTIAQWAALILYLGVGVILGCTVMLAKGFDAAMAVGGIVAVIGFGVYTFSMRKTGQLVRRESEKEEE